MRSVFIIVGGIALFGICVLAVRLIGGNPEQATGTAAKIFLPVWLIVAGVNMGLGVSQAGYPVSEEFPIFVVIFVVPAALAAGIWWNFS